MNKELSVVGVGNAMVDILIETTDSSLKKMRVKKGIMQLVSLERAKKLCSSFGTHLEVSGGSGANTMVGLASLGLDVAYIGKVTDDALGHKFRNDLIRNGVHYNTKFAAASDSNETGRCIVFVTPDGERSLNTYLGVTQNLDVTDIDISLISRTKWLYLEGYRFDGVKSEAAFSRAIQAAKRKNARIALSLSDPFCVERNLQAFRKMIINEVDLLLCNEAELKLLYQTEDLTCAMKEGSHQVRTLACTLAERGVIIAAEGRIFSIPTKETKVIDTTGAGDLFASGFLFGMSRKKPAEICGEMGNLAASEVISHYGARPQISLKQLFCNNNL